MNFIRGLFNNQNESKDLAREVKERAKRTSDLVVEVQETRTKLDQTPLPNFPISGFLVSATPRVKRVRVRD